MRVFRRLVNGKVELMVGVQVDDTIVCGEKDACDKFLGELRTKGNLGCILSVHLCEIGNQVSWR